MNRNVVIIFLLLTCSFRPFAQPVYSPGVRAQRETKWMLDSLHITTEQSNKVHDISLSYNQQMDKASELPDKEKGKTQKRLMKQKDTDLKAVLNKEQYQKYYTREEYLRKLPKIMHKGPHGPM